MLYYHVNHWVEFIRLSNTEELLRKGMTETMANRVTMSICGDEYTFVAEESAAYMQKVGAYVDEKMTELLDTAKVGRTDAAVLTAANITDELFKEREASEGLRRQLKQYLDEANRARTEISELKREIFKLQNRK